MTIDSVITIEMGAGEAIRPAWPQGTAAPGWSEVEWRAFADATGSLFGGSWEGEPGTLLLFSLGVAGLAAIGARRQRQ